MHIAFVRYVTLDSDTLSRPVLKPGLGASAAPPGMEESMSTERAYDALYGVILAAQALSPAAVLYLNSLI